MLDFDNSINTIFIMLGFACNYNCKYCMQHGSKEIFVARNDYNTDIIDFIRSVANKRMNENKKRTLLNFFGGEPLLYFNVIKDIVENLIDDAVDFSIITNGSLITDDFINYVNNVITRGHNFHVSISWDGRNTKNSRGIDVFETNKDNIFKLNGFSISGVINKYNYPREFFDDVQKIEDDYKRSRPDVEDITFGVSLDTLYNLNRLDKSDVFDIDFDYLRKQIEELVCDCYRDNNVNKYHKSYIFGMVNQSNFFVEYDKELDNKRFSGCMNGISVLNLDLDGNLYMCHDDKNTLLGNIYSEKEDYYNEYKKTNNVLPFYYKDTCNTCNIRFICNGGCMLLSKEERDNFYCKQRKSLNEPIIEFLMRVLNDEEFKDRLVNEK